MKLSNESQRIFDTIQKDYSITDEAGILLLRTVCESLDMIRLAEKEIEKHGVVITDKYKGVKANPAAAVIDKNKAAMMQALRQLNLDWDDIPKIKKADAIN